MIIDVIGLFGEPMARSSLVLVVRRQQNKFHVKKGSRMEDSFFFKKRNAGGMFPFFELRPIRQKIVDIASPVHSLHTMNRRHMTTKKKLVVRTGLNTIEIDSSSHSFFIFHRHLT